MSCAGKLKILAAERARARDSFANFLNLQHVAFLVLITAVFSHQWFYAEQCPEKDASIIHLKLRLGSCLIARAARTALRTALTSRSHGGALLQCNFQKADMQKYVYIGLTGAPFGGHALLGSVIRDERRTLDLTSSNGPQPIQKYAQPAQARDAGEVER